jgi:hypothetical protein
MTSIINTHDTLIECYICHESGGKRVTCACKNLYLHDDCLIESITKLKNSKCTICKEEYKNIINYEKKKYRLEKPGKHLLYRFIIICLSFGTTCLEFFIYIDNYSPTNSTNHNHNNYNNNYNNNNYNNRCINCNYYYSTSNNDEEFVEIIIISICYTFLFITVILCAEFVHYTVILCENNIPLYSYTVINNPIIDVLYIHDNNENV